MPKRITTSGIAHTSDATFRSWGQELSGGLQAVGLTKVACTGQIDWTTVTRAATNASAGFEVFYLNDSLHATAPIYIRIEYRTGSSSGIPAWSISIGTGVNTSTGVLTGGPIQPNYVLPRADGAVSAGTFTSLFTGGEGYFGVVFKAGTKFGPGGQDLGQFFLSRAVDSSGSLLPTGYSFMTQTTTNGSTINFRSAIFATSSFLPEFSVTNSNQIGPVYGASTTLTAGQYQAMRVQCAIPLYDHAYGMLAVVPSEVTGLTVFPATIQGGSKNFIAWPTASTVGGASTTNIRMAMLWEGSDV